jgi:hypothetical protein
MKVEIKSSNIVADTQAISKMLLDLCEHPENIRLESGVDFIRLGTMKKPSAHDARALETIKDIFK